LGVEFHRCEIAAAWGNIGKFLVILSVAPQARSRRSGLVKVSGLVAVSRLVNTWPVLRPSTPLRVTRPFRASLRMTG
jgi:hypothetical protein